ncbi:MAG: hypothetical protein J7D60_05240, partial [Prosthecochloris sp.]|nr:hypothetical protein [Prosthecochloris sp.]
RLKAKGEGRKAKGEGRKGKGGKTLCSMAGCFMSSTARLIAQGSRSSNDGLRSPVHEKLNEFIS